MTACGHEKNREGGCICIDSYSEALQVENLEEVTFVCILDQLELLLHTEVENVFTATTKKRKWQ